MGIRSSADYVFARGLKSACGGTVHLSLDDVEVVLMFFHAVVAPTLARWSIGAERTLEGGAKNDGGSMWRSFMYMYIMVC